MSHLTLPPRHSWRYTESERPRSQPKPNSLSNCYKLLPMFLLVCWTLRTAAGQGTAIPITDSDIQQIVDAHNFFRGIVDPPASNMQRMEWNSDLAMVAQNYAEMCMFDPNPDRAAQAPFDTVGENRAFGRSKNYLDLIERGWFVQRLNFDFDSNMCLSPGACDEYIQLVWAESNLVGCGAANCPQVTGLPLLSNAVAFVCNYAPEGNIPGQLPYEAGPPCSHCPQGMNFCVENSCSSVGTLPPLITTTQATDIPTSTAEEPTTTQAVVATTTELAIATTTEEEPDTTSEPLTTAVQQTTTPTPPCPPTVSPPIIVTIKPPTKKPVTPTTKRPINWYKIWLTIKHKQTVWPLTWPTLRPKPDRTGRTRSRSGSSSSRRRGSRSKTKKRSKSRRRSKSETGRRSKSKCTKRKKTRRTKYKRLRGRG